MINTYNYLRIQVPGGTPNPGESQPLDFSDPFEVIVFIILPILLFILYFVWRKSNKRNDK
ncbi:adenylosuccinate synthetase [Winogradskyella bathintestinalis]|uniref:Adenylosuccinate synthetase n=1 Tax=Winogradskyella bathintestinalis TaxID=3035208 RepID=A0ABT7ZXP4_9FLAO|nr:adenylosuccinate synthetase [Winogradskyella bathintestinalis]MDN3493789.1 adenylosuccinate synthetase [Winogradskyella bathintestinalis]